MRSAIAAILLMPSLALSQVPAKVAYQGRLLKADGTPESGTVSLTFSLWDQAIGGSLPRWKETQTVALTDGFYSVVLGDLQAFAPDAFDGSERFLEISVGSSALSPRQRVDSVPYALMAQNLSGGTVNASSVSVGGANGVSINSSGISVSGKSVVDGAGNLQLAQASASQSGLLSSADWTRFNGSAPASGSASYIQNQSAALQPASFAVGGSAGVGTATPAARLAVQGAAERYFSNPNTVAAAAGSSTVAGSGSRFTTDCAVGDVLVAGKQALQIVAIASDTSLTVTPAVGTAITASDYTVQKPIARLLKSDGSTAQLVNAQGRVGVGTATPSQELDVNGSLNVGGGIAVQSGGIFGTNNGGNLHIDSDASKSDGRIYLDYYNGNGVVFGNGKSAVAGTVDTAGNVQFNGTGKFGPVQVGNVSTGLWADANGLEVRLPIAGQGTFRVTGPGGSPIYMMVVPLFSATFVNGYLRASGDLVSATGNFASETRTNYRLVLQADRNMVLYDAGTAVWASGTSTSDIRLKKDISPLGPVLDKLDQMRVIRFKYVESLKNDDPQIGLAAQEVEKVFPEFVYTAPGGNKLVYYDKISVVALQAAKDLLTQSREQKERLAVLEARSAEQAAQLAAALASRDGTVKRLEEENASLQARLDRLERAVGQLAAGKEAGEMGRLARAK